MAVALVVLSLPLSSVFTTTAAGVLGIVTSFATARGGRRAAASGEPS